MNGPRIKSPPKPVPRSKVYTLADRPEILREIDATSKENNEMSVELNSVLARRQRKERLLENLESSYTTLVEYGEAYVEEQKQNLLHASQKFEEAQCALRRETFRSNSYSICCRRELKTAKISA